MTLSLKKAAVFLPALWVPFGLFCRSFAAGEYVSCLSFRQPKGEIVIAEVDRDTPSSDEWVPVTLLRDGSKDRFRSSGLLPLGLNRMTTLLACQQELLAELASRTPRSGRLAALHELLKIRPPDERSKRILAALKLRQEQRQQLPLLFDELVRAREFLRSSPSESGNSETDSGVAAPAEAATLLARLEQLDDEADEMLYEAAAKKDFWVVLPFAGELQRSRTRRLRACEKKLTAGDAAKLRKRCRMREEFLLSSFRKNREKWLRDPWVARFSAAFPEARGAWRQPAPQTFRQLERCLTAACLAWRRLPELNAMADLSEWGGSALDVLILFPPGSRPLKLYARLKKELETQSLPDQKVLPRRNP